MKSLLLAAALVTLGVGCAAPTPDQGQGAEQGTLQEGLTVLDVQSGKSLSVAYKKGAHVVFVQALRGKPTPDFYKDDPNTPRYEVDARFRDENGSTFLVQRGGDDWVDPTWEEELAKQELAPKKIDAEALLNLAAEAVGKLETAPELNGVETIAPELGAVAKMGKAAPITFAASVKAARDVQTGAVELHDIGDPIPGEIPYGSDKGGADTETVTMPTGYYSMDLYAGTLSAAGCLNFDNTYHSATRLHKYDSSWNYLGAVDYCNHGRCPSDSTMAWKGNVASRYKNPYPMRSCATAYHATSNDGHNCHDDSRLQMASLVYGHTSVKAPGYGYWCWGDQSHSDISCGVEWLGGDKDGHPYANTSTDRGYNHKAMCRFQNTHGYNSAGSCYCDQACVSYGDCCLDGPW